MKTYEQMTEEVLEKVKKEKVRRRGAAKTAVSFALVLVLMIGTVLVAGQVGKAPGKTAPGGAQNGKPPVLKNEDPLTAGREYGELYDLLKTNGFDPESGGSPIRGYGFKGIDQNLAIGLDEHGAESYSDGSVGYSKTNVQVEGIDEADVVKTDGKYVYAISKSNVYIFSAEDGKMETVATIPFVGDDRSSVPLSGLRVGWGAPEIYVTDVRMIVVFSVYKPETDEQGNENPFYSFKQYYAAAVYDITDRAAPALVGTASIGGFAVSSRMTDGKLYLVASEGFRGFVDRDDPETYIPTLYKNGVAELVGADSIYYGGDESDCTYLNVMEISVSDASVTSNLSLLGYTGEIMYQSPDNIFVARTDNKTETEQTTEDGTTVETYYSKDETVISKISVSGGLALAGTARIDGRLLNSFSMDEHEGYLRVVTSVQRSTNGQRWIEGLSQEEIDRYLAEDEQDDAVMHYWYDEETGRLYCLDEQDNWDFEENNDLYVLDPSMNVTGSIVGLAPDERIYSCRFEGNDGYFVTFRETDPLFHVDLSDPANPRVIDELKIPGHSDYLQRFGEYMLGFGQDDDGFLKLSMFSEDENGVMSEIAVISLPGTQYSDALHDHHAILADAERGIICFGAYGYYDDNSLYGSIYYIVTWDGQEFGVAVKSELGEDCGTLRGFYIGDYFYLYVDSNVAAGTLTSYSLSDFGEIDRETMDEPNNDPDPYYSGYVTID